MKIFLEDFTVADFSRLDQSLGLTAETWMVSVEVEGDLGPDLMVEDFGTLKQSVRRVVAEMADHKLLVPSEFPGLRWRQTPEGRVGLETTIPYFFAYQAPAEAVSVLDGSVIDAPSLARTLERRMAAGLPGNVRSLRLSLREAPSTGVTYRYSHGLLRHPGNCQRLGHGHRSSMQIWRNGERHSILEELMAARWNHRYLGTASLAVRPEENGRTRFRNEGSQGLFELDIDSNHCEILPEGNTVECMAQLTARELKAADSTAVFRTRLYEGAGKGAEVEL